MRQATDVFGEWAEKGRDIGMAKGHAVSVSEMLSFISEERKELDKQFSFLDLGCGNGWAVRDARVHEAVRQRCAQVSPQFRNNSFILHAALH